MYFEWKPYVSVAQKLAKARKYAERKAKKEGRKLLPVQARGRKFTTTFWGQAWCDNLDRYSDFANRLARGRTYFCPRTVNMVSTRVCDAFANSCTAEITEMSSIV